VHPAGRTTFRRSGDAPQCQALRNTIAAQALDSAGLGKQQGTMDMKLKTILAVTLGAAALAACGQEAADDTANMDANAMMTDETVLPVDNTMGTDTLGNQMNQLNETDNAMDNVTDNAADNTVNTY
jgi:hypothetical protein